MLTDTDLQLLREFLSNPDNYSNLYGCMTLPHQGGTLIINNGGEKPIDYFLIGDTINGIPFTRYIGAILTKKHLDGSTQTIVLPKIKIV